MQCYLLPVVVSVLIDLATSVFEFERSTLDSRELWPSAFMYFVPLYAAWAAEWIDSKASCLNSLACLSLTLVLFSCLFAARFIVRLLFRNVSCFVADLKWLLPALTTQVFRLLILVCRRDIAWQRRSYKESAWRDNYLNSSCVCTLLSEGSLVF